MDHCQTAHEVRLAAVGGGAGGAAAGGGAAGGGAEVGDGVGELDRDADCPRCTAPCQEAACEGCHFDSPDLAD